MKGLEHFLKPHFFRTEAVHRGLVGSKGHQMLGAGFLLKPGRTGQHVGDVFPYYSGVLVLRGEGTYLDWRGVRHGIYPGCYFQRIPGRRHGTTHPAKADWAECYLNICRPLAMALASIRSLAFDRPVLHPGLSTALVERFDLLVNELSAAPAQDLARMLVSMHELVVDIYILDRRGRRPERGARELEEAARRLAADTAEWISVPALAEEVGLGYEYFRKAFRKRFGVSPGDYRIRRRIERSRSMLSQEGMTVKEVAFRLGYPNPFIFSRQFKQVLGAPPSRFMRLP